MFRHESYAINSASPSLFLQESFLCIQTPGRVPIGTASDLHAPCSLVQFLWEGLRKRRSYQTGPLSLESDLPTPMYPSVKGKERKKASSQQI